MSGPTVIVICAGEATRWGDHRGTPKHLLAPEGERLLDRTVRLAREHGAGRVLVVSKPGDARYEADGAERVDARLTPSNADADKFLSSRHLWAPDGRTVVLYGDVWFDDEAMALILGDERRQWLLWCRPGASQTTGATSGECFAVTFWPEHHAEYEQALHRVASLWRAGLLRRCGGWETYRAMCGRGDRELRTHRMYGRYEVIGGWTEDFDKPLDYERWLDRRRGRSVSVVIPWRPAPGRQRILGWVRRQWQEAFPTWQVVTGRAPEGTWRKGAAVQDGIRRAQGTTIIVADADVWCDGIEQAVDEVAAGRAKWAMPHTLVRRLTEEATEKVLEGGPLDGPTVETHPGMAGGGMVVLTRQTARGVPMDPGFEGWGQEDQAWAVALETLAGPMWRGTADLVHLWHPPAERLSRASGSREGLARYRRYLDARDRPAAMRALLAEFCTSPLKGSPLMYRYRNANTGDEVEYAHRNARLEMLPNWSRIPAETAPEPEQYEAAPAAPEQPGEAPGPAPEPVPVPVPVPPVEETAVVARPAVSASKAAWVEYALGMAQDSDEAAEITTLTKAQLIDRYGSKEN